MNKILIICVVLIIISLILGVLLGESGRRDIYLTGCSWGCHNMQTVNRNLSGLDEIPNWTELQEEIVPYQMCMDKCVIKIKQYLSKN